MNKINLKNYKKFEKQIILKEVGLNGQQKIFSSKIAIVGLGGLGCPLALYLASSGILNLALIDHDEVEYSNLNRQVLFNENEIGQSKTKLVKKKLLKINQNIKIKDINFKLDNNNIDKILDKYDTFLLDMWGVLHDGSKPYEGVLQTVKELKAMGKNLIILSNSSKRRENSHKMLGKREFQ